MTVMKNMDTESILLDFSFEGEEPQSSSLVLGDPMDYGTFGNLSDAYLSDICDGSDLVLHNPLLNNTITRESISSSHPLYESLVDQNPEFSFNNKISSPSSSADYLYPDTLDKYFLDDHRLPSLLNCGNFMKSPLSSEDVDSILDTTSLSDYGDISLSPLGSPLPSPGIALSPEDSPVSSSLPTPTLLVAINESDGTQASSSPVLDLSPGYAATGEEPSRSCSPHLLVSVSGKEKRTKSYRTKKTPYSWDKSTESIPSPIDILDQPQTLSKKEKKKLQNKNAATRYRQKMKEETELRKQEEDELLEENVKLKQKVTEIQREIQYLKNLLSEINKARLKQ